MTWRNVLRRLIFLSGDMECELHSLGWLRIQLILRKFRDVHNDGHVNMLLSLLIQHRVIDEHETFAGAWWSLQNSPLTLNFTGLLGYIFITDPLDQCNCLWNLKFGYINNLYRNVIKCASCHIHNIKHDQKRLCLIRSLWYFHLLINENKQENRSEIASPRHPYLHI